MTSEYERQAARAAVDAVERRWKRDDTARRKQRLRKRIVSFLAGTTLLFGAVAAGVGFWLWKRGATDLSGALETGVEIGRSIMNPMERTDASLDEYVQAVNSLMSAPVKLSRDLPIELKPKKAAQGITYLALCRTREGRLSVFRLVADGRGGSRIWHLSPAIEPVEVPFAEFKRSRDGCPYLVVVGDSAYLYGSSKLKDAEALRAAVRAGR